MRKFHFVQSLTKQGLLSQSKTRGRNVVALVINKRISGTKMFDY